MTSTAGTRPGNAFLTSLLAGLFVLAFVLATGVTYVLRQPVVFEATSSFAVFPRSATTQGSEASYYETLSRGQIVTTLAQVVSGQQRAPGEDLLVQVIPETSLVTLTARAATAADAELLATRGLRSAIGAVDELGLPFTARVVDAGPGTGAEAGSGAPRLLAIVVLVSLVLGAVTQQTVVLLARRRG